MKKLQLLIILCAILGKESKAIVIDTTKMSEYDTSKSFIALPVIVYSEETRWGFGASTGYYSNGKYNKTSSLQLNALVTLNKQFTTAFVSDIYTPSGNYFNTARVKANYYPNKFYGIGRNTEDSLEESYTSKDFSVHIQRQKMLFGKLMFGLQYNLYYYDITDIKQNGLIQSGIIGSNKFLISGFGVLLTWDSRDYRFWPESGSFVKLSTMLNNKLFGSEYDNTNLSVDIRTFINFYRKMVLAMQVYGDFNWNEIPFQLMPKLGGQDILRGYYNGRYRDKMMIVAQAEIRFDIYRWLRGVTFASLGDVAPSIDLFKPNGAKYSYGFGLRVRANSAKVNVRADIAFTGNRGSVIYLTAIEAF